MSADKFSFEGLESIERRLIRRSEEIGYIVIQDRTIPRKDDTLGRFDFTAECALAWSECPGEEDEEPADEEEAEPEDEPDEEGEAPVESPMAKAVKMNPAEEIARAACRWIRDIATRNTIGERYTRFRVKVWSPKGNRMIDSGQFVCRNHEVDLDLPPEPQEPELRIPTPDFDQAAVVGSARAIKALGDYYAQWGQIVLGSVGQLQGVNNAMMARLHKQLQESREQIDQLVAAILEYRFQESVADDTRRKEDREVDVRNVLAEQAINQFGQAVKVFAATRGMSPELTEAVSVIGSCPELTAALSDPDVKLVMQDPRALKTFAMWLKQAGLQARAAQAHAPDPQSSAG